MARKPLTQREVDRLTLPTGRRDITVWDGQTASAAGGSLAYRLTAGGSRTWVLVHRRESQETRERIGDGKLRLADARVRAANRLAELENQANLGRGGEVTLGQAVPEFIARQEERGRKPRGIAEQC